MWSLRRHTGLFLALLILVSACIVHGVAGYSSVFLYGDAWGIDDAYISYRYARNFVEGRGLVFNPGEAVEGYSNLLYVLLVSPAFLVLDDSQIYAFSVGLNILCMATALIVFYRRLCSSFGNTGAVVGALLFACYPPGWIAVGSGLETALVVALQVGIWTAVERIVEGDRTKDILLLIALVILSILARADGFVTPVIAASYLLVRSKPRAAACALLTAAVAVATHFTWRYTYYGYLLPNTYYVKISGPPAARAVNAARQLADVFFRQGLAALPLSFCFILMRHLGSVRARGVIAVRSIPFEIHFSLAWLLYWCYIGGDNLGDRFLIILGLMWISCLVRLIVPVLDRRTLAYVVAVVVLAQAAPLASDRRFAYSMSKYDCWLSLGRFLAERYPAATIGIDAAGKVPFVSHLRVIDMLGLNDLHIAHKKVDTFGVLGHDKYDADYVLSKRPELIGAALITERMDMQWDLRRSKYEAAGYRLRYVLRTHGPVSGEPIVDVNGMNENAIQILRQKGFAYGILVRDDVSPTLSSAGQSRARGDPGEVCTARGPVTTL